MVLYGLTLVVPLAKALRDAVPSVVQPWYADGDAAMSGPSKCVGEAMDLLQQLGPARGYFPEPSKSIVVCHEARMDQAKANLARFKFQYCDGHRYVGGFIGTEEAKAKWLEPKIQAWVYGVEQLARVARRFPQAAYAGLVKSLQSEWQFLQRVLPDNGTAFQRIEKAIREAFLPILMQSDNVVDRDREFWALPVQQAGLGIPAPNETTEGNRMTSILECTKLLTQSLQQGTDLDVAAYLADNKKGLRDAAVARTMEAETKLESLTSNLNPYYKRQISRARQTGSWLAVMPDTLNGTVLSAEEFQDSLRVRYGLEPVGLQPKCDGCYKDFTVTHALSCKTGGLVILHHNELAKEWHRLCAQALTPSAVSDKPLIPHSGRDLQAGIKGKGQEVLPAE